jgi:hypothetical protein
MIRPVSLRYRGNLRVFAYSMPEQSRQTTYLVALAALIKVIPRAAYAHELPTVSRLLACGQATPCRVLAH